MDTSNIVFCTAAYNKKYIDFSKELIASFLQHTKNSKLVILHNDPYAYSDCRNENLIVVYDNYDYERERERKIKYPHDGSFPFNITYRVLRQALFHTGAANVICYLDADCRLRNELSNEHFSDLKFGLNVPFSFFPDGKYDKHNIHKFPVVDIKNRIFGLIKNEDEINFLQFREACLLFSNVHNPKFRHFLYEWMKLYYQIEDQLYTHGGQFMEMNLALNRANVPLNDIMQSNYFPYLQSTIMTLNYVDWKSEMSALR
jgi:hypothetical protein